MCLSQEDHEEVDLLFEASDVHGVDIDIHIREVQLEFLIDLLCVLLWQCCELFRALILGSCKDLELSTVDDEVELGQLSQVSLEEFTALLDRVLVVLSGESLLREEWDIAARP